MSLYPNLLETEVSAGPASVRVYDNALDVPTPTIVLVHGTGGSAERNFWALYPMLAFGHRVVALDLALPVDDEVLTLDTYVQQVEEVIENSRDDRGVTLVGYSLGAVVALKVAAKRPDLVDSLVSIAGWMKTDRHQLLRNDVWRQLHRDGSAALGKFNVFANYSPMYLSGRTETEYEEILNRGVDTRYPTAVMDLNREIDIVDEVHSIKVPTLVLACTHDQVVQPRHSQEIFGAISDARYAEIPSGHAVVHERPAELFAYIDRFVSNSAEFSPGTVIEQADW